MSSITAAQEFWASAFFLRRLAGGCSTFVLVLAFTVSFPSVAQRDSCSGFVTASKKSHMRKSKEAMIFKLGDVNTDIRLDNMGRPNSLRMIMGIRDGGKKPVDCGDMLKIRFGDGTQQEVLASWHKTGSGTLYFILLQPGGRGKSIAVEDDLAFREKLIKVPITSLRLTVRDVQQDIVISKNKGDSLRAMIKCLTGQR